MKKWILSLSLIFISASAIQAQVAGNGNDFERLAYEKGDLSLNAGISFGLIGYGYGYYGNRSFPIPLTVNANYGFGEYISAGAFLGYMRVSYSDNSFNSNYSLTFNNFSFGAQATFHASTFLKEEFDFAIDDSKIDYYGKLILGIETYSWNYDGPVFDNYYDDNGADVIFGPVLGVRYMFAPNFGAYVEGGRGTYGWVTLGASLKL